MKISRFTSAVVFLVLAAGASACVNNEIPIGRDEGSANLDLASTVKDYGFCSADSGGTCGLDWPMSGTAACVATSVADENFDCYCVRGCARDSECPVPKTGTAKPTCGSVYDATIVSCVLPC